MTKLKKKKKKELARNASEAVAEAAVSSLVDESVFKDSSAQTGSSLTVNLFSYQTFQQISAEKKTEKWKHPKP